MKFLLLIPVTFLCLFCLTSCTVAGLAVGSLIDSNTSADMTLYEGWMPPPDAENFIQIRTTDGVRRRGRYRSSASTETHIALRIGWKNTVLVPVEAIETTVHERRPHTGKIIGGVVGLVFDAIVVASLIALISAF